MVRPRSFLATTALWLMMLLCITTAHESLRRRLKTPNFCRVGYIMDEFCISLGTLLDKPTLRSLRYPDQHSLECLIEVPSCVASGWEILSPPTAAGKDYGRVAKFNAAGNTMLMAYAKKYGLCGICSGTGTISEGLRATVIGYVAPSTLTRKPTNSTPPYVNVTQILPASVGCSKFAPATPTKKAPPTRKPTAKPSKHVARN
jgi:cell division septation protein DedD